MRSINLSGLALAALLASVGTARAQEAKLSPNAPRDRPVSVVVDSAGEVVDPRLVQAMTQARATYPDARRRYLAGLPPGYIFYVVTRLRDATGQWEQSFIRVSGIADGRVTGTVASNMRVVSGFRFGDAYTLPETDVIDWLVARPDGSEEGNFVGKTMDALLDSAPRG